MSGRSMTAGQSGVQHPRGARGIIGDLVVRPARAVALWIATTALEVVRCKAIQNRASGATGGWHSASHAVCGNGEGNVDQKVSRAGTGRPGPGLRALLAPDAAVHSRVPSGEHAATDEVRYRPPHPSHHPRPAALTHRTGPARFAHRTGVTGTLPRTGQSEPRRLHRRRRVRMSAVTGPVRSLRGSAPPPHRVAHPRSARSPGLRRRLRWQLGWSSASRAAVRCPGVRGPTASGTSSRAIRPPSLSRGRHARVGRPKVARTAAWISAAPGRKASSSAGDSGTGVNGAATRSIGASRSSNAACCTAAAISAPKPP